VNATEEDGGEEEDDFKLEHVDVRVGAEGGDAAYAPLKKWHGLYTRTELRIMRHIERAGVPISAVSGCYCR
jgi:hypothetical protein